MVQWPGARILRRQELDAFLAQALSPKLYEPDQLQELKVTNTSFLVLEPCSGVKGQLTSPGRWGHQTSNAQEENLRAFRAKEISFPAIEMVKSTFVWYFPLYTNGCFIRVFHIMKWTCLLFQVGIPNPGREGLVLRIS